MVAATTISSTVFNALTADLATGLSTAICKDGQTTATASIPFAQGIALASTKKLYLDGVAATGDTYVVESAGNTLDLVAGGTTAISLTTVATLGMNVALGANYISRAGTAAGLSLDASNNATLSGTLTVSGAMLMVNAPANTYSRSVATAGMYCSEGTAGTPGIEFKNTTSGNYGYLTVESGDVIQINPGNSAAVKIVNNLTVAGGTITTGSTTALSLATGGGTQVKVSNIVDAVNYWEFYGGATGSPGVLNAYATGTDTNIDLGFNSKGSGVIHLATGGGTEQVRITHTTDADRYITLTGSDGGNPTIGVSAGTLRFGANVICANAGAVSAPAYAFDDDADTGWYGGATSVSLAQAGVDTVKFAPSGASVIAGGIRIGTDSTNNLIDDASNGAGTATLYIGNASINVTSDERVKSNIKPIEDGLSIINALQPIEFDQDEERPWGDQRHYMGFGARASHKVAPWAVHTQGDTGLPWKMRQEFLMAPTVRAVQQLCKRIEELEARLA